MIVVDTNILVDLREDDAEWRRWSFNAVAVARITGDVVTSTVTIGELATRSGTLAELEQLCAGFGIRIAALSAAGAHSAGLAQRAYRAAGGPREKLLADFMIGGEAKALNATLLTRDPSHYRRYFPELNLITPETDA